VSSVSHAHSQTAWLTTIRPFRRGGVSVAQRAAALSNCSTEATSGSSRRGRVGDSEYHLSSVAIS
jgi:hypothetical protein